MMSSLEKFREAKKEIKDLKKKLKSQVKDVFYAAVKELFNEYPDLKSISWTGYTPYFNDGDTCEFSSNHEYPDINGVGDWADPTEEEAEAYEKIDKKVRDKMEKAVRTFMKEWDDDDMYDLFGDHVQVTVTKKGISTEHYDHD